VERILQDSMTMSEKGSGKKTSLEIQAKEAFGAFKDWLILLDMAGEYLCGATFLEKMSTAIKEAADVLKNRAQELKGRFVGKPMHEIDMTSSFQELELFCDRLRETEGKLEDRCRQGKIARELEERVRALKEGLGILQDRVEGETDPYTAKDSLKGFLEKLKVPLRGFVRTYKVATRLIGMLFLAGLISFFALYFTMEKAGDVERDIRRIEHTILVKEAKLADIRNRIAEIQSKAMKTRSSFVSRDEKISLLEQNLKVHKLNDEKEKLQSEVDQQKEVLNQGREKLQRLRSKSFLASLLRM
jgi:hypothetical protein